MPVSPVLDIHSVTVGTIAQNTLCVPLSTVTNAKTVETQALINLLNKLSRRSLAMPSQVMVFAQGDKITPLLRPWSTTTKIE